MRKAATREALARGDSIATDTNLDRYKNMVATRINRRIE